MRSLLLHLRRLAIDWLRRQRVRQRALRRQRASLRRRHCACGIAALAAILAGGAALGHQLAPVLGPVAASIAASLPTSALGVGLAGHWHQAARNMAERWFALHLCAVALAPLLVPLAEIALGSAFFVRR